MKTKKEIWNWYLDKGEDINNRNDLANFREKIDERLSLQSTERTIVNKQLIITLQSPRWKHNLMLWFQDNECFKISGF